MNRRSFLSLFGSAAAVAVAKPAYFFAPKNGWLPQKVYSFKDINGIVVPDYNPVTAIGEDLDRIGRLHYISRKPGIITVDPETIQILHVSPWETDAELRNRIMASPAGSLFARGMI